MSASRDTRNRDALAVIRGLVPPAPELPQQAKTCAQGGGGGGGGRPIDWESPDATHTLYAEADDASTRVILQDICGSQVRLQILADGSASVRVIDCTGAGYKLTPSGLQQITVTDPGGESESETPVGSPLGMVTVQACVDGVTKTLHLVGYVDP